MIRTLIDKLITFFQNPFKKKKTEVIPFAKQSKEAVANKKEPRRKEKFPPQKGNKRKNGEFARKKQGDVVTLKSDQKQQPVKKTQTITRPKPQQQQPQQKQPQKQQPQRQKPKPRIEPKKQFTPWDISEFDVPPEEGKVRFHDIDLHAKIMRAIFDLNFKYCSPIQAGILPETLKGADAIGQAQTGTGKSAAFLITIISHLIKNPIKGGPKTGFPRALILAPTRELALQIERDAVALCKYTPYRVLALFGGTDYEKQRNTLQTTPVDIVVATPGRLIDFKNQKAVNLGNIELLVLDEADRMLDMGFIPDIRKIVYSTPPKEERRTMFFSATYTPDVMRLAEQWTKDPHHVKIEPEKVESDSVSQFVYLITESEKFPLIYNLLKTHQTGRVLVFTNRRDQARNLSEKLTSHGMKTALLSGEVHQNKRIRALESFRSGAIRILVATDVAARGLHIDDISHVINYNMPQDAEHYVHRIGRTGRAGATGISVSFADEDDSFYIPAIEEFLGHKMECEYPDDALVVPIPGADKAETIKEDDNPRKKAAPRPYRKQVKKRPVGDKSAPGGDKKGPADDKKGKDGSSTYNKRKPQGPRYRKRQSRAPKN